MSKRRGTAIGSRTARGGPVEEISVEQMALEKCQSVLAGWRDRTVDDFEFDPPKGFSSFTMGIRARRPREDGIDPPAVL